ncbi:HD domain-containing phosphohydrolase [Thiosulfativibrio zosterae]|uniref:Two-component system response regulator n=1 Tax=Thiosulfativibrio zosterae TaxID=2675053 RepID=A0A6F8PLE0_9GAMM|nr:HD domain-containing phosphohydrolase [Thiosulfativibrio zosterae]BBP42919.1 two-component system response regulator [Thiosulfativibrio zosterae]
MKPVILCVDDTPANLTLLHGHLNSLYTVKLLNSGEKALAFLKKERVDLILLDVMMPGLDGYEVCRHIRQDATTAHIPILFITAKNMPEDEEEALNAGGNDFISKPINPRVLMARIKTHLDLKNFQDWLQNENALLEKELEKRLTDIFKLQDASMGVMISLAEFRDECTGNHIKRTQLYITELANEVAAALPEYQLDSREVNLISKCTPLHDIGKITTPDSVLLKPGKLDHDEFEIMKLHVQKGYDILESASKNMGYYGEFLHVAQVIVMNHHEKWDGSGYPNGLAGKEIPLPGRLMAIVDVYDALRSERPYKKGFSHEEALDIMKAQSGKHFDPELLECFINIEAKLPVIHNNWSDRH